MVHYFDAQDKQALRSFYRQLSFYIEEKRPPSGEIVLVCIGSDRATGDCLGPLIGHRLVKQTRSPHFGQQKSFSIYGTLEKPVHAKNLATVIKQIDTHHSDALVIAIDACLGMKDHIGYVTLGEGSLKPGVGVDKSLPNVGDIFITGIVNMSGFGGQLLLQTTHLHTVMQLADFICLGIYSCLTRKNMYQTPLYN